MKNFPEIDFEMWCGNMAQLLPDSWSISAGLSPALYFPPSIQTYEGLHPARVQLSTAGQGIRKPVILLMSFTDKRHLHLFPLNTLTPKNIWPTVYRLQCATWLTLCNIQKQTKAYMKLIRISMHIHGSLNILYDSPL